MLDLSHEQLQQLYRYGYSLTAHEQEAYDLLHHVIERCLSKQHEPDHPVRYIMRAMRNRFIDEQRRHKRAPHVSLEQEGVGEAMDLGAQSLEQQVISKLELQSIWPTLEVEERELLYLWAVEEYTIAEIAAHHDAPRNTVLSRFHRLRTRLQTRFGSRENAS